MNFVNKKILWLADHDIEKAPGGAQRSDKIIIDQGKLLGFNIKKVNHETFASISSIHDFDIVISSNVTVLFYKYRNLPLDLSNHKFHIRLEHDSNAHITKEQRVKLFSNCKKTYFLSDYHYSFFKELYGDIFYNVAINYDPIDTSFFKNFNKPRENKILYAGYMHEQKGTDYFFDYVLKNPDKQFAVAAFTSSKIYEILCNNISNIEFLKHVPYEEMNSVYNDYESIFYNPIVREPFCRCIAEAALCGMKILTGCPEKIGCLQEINKIGIESFSTKCNSAAKDFWN
mgnify:CR=1 FL=1